MSFINEIGFGVKENLLILLSDNPKKIVHEVYIPEINEYESNALSRDVFLADVYWDFQDNQSIMCIEDYYTIFGDVIAIYTSRVCKYPGHNNL